ncbi:7902_t:CDS:2, partial [Funneliformis mosseae]
SLKETSSNEASSATSSETVSSVTKTSDATFQSLKSNDVLTKFRNLWWTDGNIHPSANWDEASDVDWEKYTERNDMYNVHGWEWINGNVYVYELPLLPHEICIGAIEGRVRLADPQEELISLRSARTKAGNKGKEADGSFIPRRKPKVNSNGREGTNSLKPWPNLVIEVAFFETEAHLLNAVKDYWLYPGRAHDAIAVKLVRSDTIISKLKIKGQSGELIPVSPQQHVINLKRKCLFHGMPPTFQTPTSIPDPLTVDFYEVICAMLDVDELRIL